MKMPFLTGLLILATPVILRSESPPAEPIELKAAPGFEAERVFAAGASDGSWSAMAVDPRGRLVISPQGSEPMLRVALPEDGKPARVEKLDVPVTSAMGLLFAFDSFYVNGKGPQGSGLYRLRDTKRADAYDEVTLLRRFEGQVNGEHGSHGLVLGPDGHIYLTQGNHTLPPKDASPASPFRHYGEDQLLPSANYGVSSGDRCKAPAGHILRLDADARNVEIFAGGFRNVYDLAFDAHGELFAFDSDTEYNWGLPWYAPMRILHVVSGGDYGFREGTGKWPTYYADALPPAVNVGLGSPTGTKFGTLAAFPEPYRRALFALDWSFGRILCVHLEPRGASATGRFETFLQGRPLNLTAIEFGRDGALYFITGGRKTRSALYRVRYTGDGAKGPEGGAVERAAEERHALESLHGRTAAETTSKVWPFLGSGDRFLRHAARIAIESQPVARWDARALSEEEPRTALTALLALARVGLQEDRAAVVRRVARWWPRLQDEDLQLDALRVAAVALARHGRPYPETQGELQSALDPAYPAKSPALNRELSQLLIALEAPNVVSRTLALVRQAATLEEQLQLVFPLRSVRAGWSAADREEYFRWFTRPQRAHPQEVNQWFADVRLHYADGASLPVYLANIRREAAATLTDAERRELGPLIDAPLSPVVTPVQTQPRRFVKEWTSAELLPHIRRLSRPRPAERGREALAVASCLACHRYANEGGALGPDLAAVAYKLGDREMLESLIEPSKVLSDQFQNTIVALTSGQTRVGRILERGRDKIVLSVNPLGGDREEIAKADIEAMRPSPVSPMPSGLLNTLTLEEILDLFAYLGFGKPATAAGDAHSPVLAGTETFPRVAMLWSPAEGLQGTQAQRMAKYDLSVVGVQAIGLRWQRHEHPDLAETFEPATIDAARATLAGLRAANPRTLVCCEVYFFEARQNAYPSDHAWWFRDAKGQKVSFWRGADNMDVGNAEYIAHVARRILAVHDAVEGKAGIFLDNLRFDPTARRGWTSLIQQLRAARPDIVVLVNSGWSSINLEWIAPQVNGILYEDSVAHTRDHDTEAFYRRVGEHWSLLRNPRISVNEKFGARSDTESLRRELSRTLVYTDAAFTYTDSTNGHRHSWRSEFDISLGKPLDPARTPMPGQLARRDFAGGTVVWLPASASAPVTIEFDTPHATLPGVAPARSFTLSPGTGLILVRMP